MMNTSGITSAPMETYLVTNATANITDTSSGQHPRVKYASIMLLVLVVFVVVGNCLVVISIARYRELRTITNSMILSLAIADLLIGVIVMPLNISNEVLHYWPYGQDMCDLWHSFDVLASTASILNLCIISLDRYWAVTNPIAYPRLMSDKRGLQCISAVWICSSLISFPSIAWWRYVDKVIPGECHFTENTLYLVFSSMISFYIPVSVMVVVYIKIFLVLKDQSKQHSETLRAHRGGGGLRRDESCLQPLSNDFELGTKTSASELRGSVSGPYKGGSFVFTSPNQRSGSDVEPSNLKRLINKINVSSSKRADSNLSNEFRVARTLGVVLGIFLVFWLPFFVCSLLFALCKDCIENKMIFTFVTWLGHTNSGVNPVIYALSMENMRHAFISIITCQYDHYYNFKKTRNRKFAVPPRNVHVKLSERN